MIRGKLLVQVRVARLKSCYLQVTSASRSASNWCLALQQDIAINVATQLGLTDIVKRLNNDKGYAKIFVDLVHCLLSGDPGANDKFVDRVNSTLR